MNLTRMALYHKIWAWMGMPKSVGFENGHGFYAVPLERLP
jgi:hypothetical protein